MAAKKKAKSIESETGVPDLSEPINVKPNIKTPSDLEEMGDNLVRDLNNVINHKDFPNEMQRDAYSALSLIKVLAFKIKAAR